MLWHGGHSSERAVRSKGTHKAPVSMGLLLFPVHHVRKHAPLLQLYDVEWIDVNIRVWSTEQCLSRADKGMEQEKEEVLRIFNFQF